MSRNKAASGWMFGAVITLLALFASLLGLLTAVLPPWAIVAVLSLPLFFALASRFPECGLLFVLLLLTGLVPSYLLPHLPLLGGQVNASDLFLAVLFPLALVQGRRDLVAALSSQTAVVLLLAVVFLSLLISMAIAFGYAGNDRKAILAESRILMYWAVLPVALAALGNEARRRRFVLGLVLVGLAVAAGQIIQAVAQVQVFEGSRLETAETLGRSYTGAVRSVAPGIMVLMFGLILSITMFLVGSRRRMTWLLIFAVLALGLLFTYGRTLWAIALLGILVVGFSVGIRRLLPLAMGLATAGAVVAAVLGFLKPVVLEAMVDRALSVQSEVKFGGSFTWREIENRYALAVLTEKPLIGVAMGGNYKPYLTPELLPEQTRHIHNGYLYMALKLGVPAAVLVLSLLLFVLVGPLLRYRRYRGQGLLSAAALAAPVFALLPFLSALTRPEWMTSSTIAMVSVAVALTVHLRVRQMAGSGSAPRTAAPTTA